MEARHTLAYAVATIICTTTICAQENYKATIDSKTVRTDRSFMTYDYPEARFIAEEFKIHADSILKSTNVKSMGHPATGYWHTGKNGGDKMLPTFDRNPFAFDFNSGMDISRWRNGALSVNMSRTTYPGLMSAASGSVSLMQNAGNFTFTANLNANRMLLQKGMTTQFGIGGSATYRFNDNISATLFGNYYNKVPYISMGAMPYVGSSSFGGYLTFMQDKAGIDLGAEQVYDPYSRRWITVPIVTPKIRINEKFTLDLPLGWLVKDLLDDLIHDNRRNGSPTILPSFPPPVVR